MEITTLQIVLVFGDMKTGIIIGGTLEMIALGWMNIGAAVAPDAALASIISTVLVIAGHQSIGAGIALAIPLAAAGQVLTIIVRTITVAFQHAADKAAENGNLTALSWLHVSSLFLQAMRIAIPAVIVAISVGTSEVQSMLNAIPEVVTGGLNIAGGMIVVVGYAMVINMMRAGYLMPFFYLGFVTAAFTNRVHGTSNVCRRWVFVSPWYRLSAVCTRKTTTHVSRLLSVTWNSLTPIRT